jgi:hypothetical protein
VAAVRAFADVLVALDEPGGLNRTKPGGRPHAARTGPPTPPRR